MTQFIDKNNKREVKPMVEYYSSKQEFINALENAKSRKEVKKIMTDLEQRIAPPEWIVMAIVMAYEKYKKM